MKKIYREAIHYVILALVLTISVFISYFLSTLTNLMDYVNSTNFLVNIVGWILLFILYFFIIGLTLTILDLILHTILKL